MRPVLFVLCATAIAGAASSMPAPAQAQDYPWCAQYSERTGGGTNCGFVTLRQCQATISGVGGICQPNPRYIGGGGYDRRERRYYGD